jgi:hypothetical protein
MSIVPSVTKIPPGVEHDTLSQASAAPADNRRRRTKRSTVDPRALARRATTVRHAPAGREIDSQRDGPAP